LFVYCCFRYGRLEGALKAFLVEMVPAHNTTARVRCQRW
jgi:hypothetical protein